MKLALCFVFGFALEAANKPCSTCHQAQAAVTPMTHALEAVEQCTILKENPKLDFESGGYRYSIVRQGNASRYSVTDGKGTITAPLDWAFGLGEAGQTYVFERNGKLYESRVSFYRERNGLDLTLGAVGRKAATLEEAAGREMSPQGAGECFNCHATNAVQKGVVHLAGMVPGLECVRCHAGGETHAAAAQQGIAKLATMAKLGKLSSEDTSNFCGQCHRTWADIATNGPQGINNVRFQPYRLANSKCYDATDPRISCVACHNPHQTVSAKASDYDAKCQNCHVSAKSSPVKICTVAKENCTTCHMPKIELPGAHHAFTDHQIRIARANGAYPN